MMEKREMTTSMIKGNPLKLMLQFAFPLLLGNLLQQTYNIIDAAIVGQILGAKALACVGASRTPFIFLALFAVLNIFLDLFCIVVLKLGCAGAAIATISAQAISGILCLIFIIRKMKLLWLKKENRAIKGDAVKELLAMGMPTGLQFSITAIGSMVMQSANNGLGSTYVSAFTATMKIKQFTMCPFDPIATSASVFCSQNLGAGQCHRAMSGMAKKLRKNVNRAMNLLNEYQQDKFDKVQRKENLIDKYESRLGDYLMKLTKHEMNSAQTKQASLYLHTINDFERIGDHASYIAYMSSEMHDNHTNFSQEAWDELNVVMEAVREEINLTCRAFLNDDKEMAQRVAPLGMIITSLCNELKMHHVERLSNGNCGLEEGTVYTDILNSFNRIAAHCASAMVALLKSGDENPDMHIHDSKIYPSDSVEYYTYFKEYRQKYEIVKNEEHMRSMEPEEVE